MINDAELFKTLSDASNGLLFQTELDYPFEVFIHDNTKETIINKETILKLMNGSPQDPIEESDIDTFFSTPTLEQDWHSPEDKKRVVRLGIWFPRLRKTLRK